MNSLQELKYSEILSLNRELGNKLSAEPEFKIAVLSNIIVNQLKDVLEYSCRSEGINATSQFGDYDNIVQDSSKYKASSTVIVFWELCNLTDGFQYNSNILTEEELNSLIQKTKSEIGFVINEFKNTPLVIFNKFSSLVFNHLQLKENNFDRACKELNDYLLKNCPSNFFVVDIEKVIARKGIETNIDLRYYFSSKALYSIEFLKSYSQFILPVILSVKGKSKKALILDCDNTLWKGIIGEDGADGIKISSKSKEGVPFDYIQSIALQLNKQGVLLALNSKNNPEDVDAVLKNHPDQKIQDKHLAIKKVNWSDKVSNIKAIAKDLNIGADSFIMVDDSDFETNFIKENLPHVSVLQVPEKIHEYPFRLIEAAQRFFNLKSTAEDAKKTEMYKQEAMRENEKENFSSVEDYLKSLELHLTIKKNDHLHIARNSQLTQKTNQFNLTTKRYTEVEIKNFTDNNNNIVYDFSLSDKFGDYGLTGVAIIEVDKTNATIDSLLMSCRVIGRNVEKAFMNHIISELKERGVKTLNATYIKTLKNDQVKNFYEQFGFRVDAGDEKKKEYKLDIDNYKTEQLPYIKITK